MNKKQANNGPVGGKDQGGLGGSSVSSEGPHGFKGRRSPDTLDEAAASAKQMEQLKGARDQPEEVVERRSKTNVREFISNNCDFTVSTLSSR